MLGSLIVTPFLPGDQKADHGKVCNITANNDTGAVTGGNYSVDLAEADKLPNLIWPFTIIAAVNVFCALSYLCLGKKKIILLSINHSFFFKLFLAFQCQYTQLSAKKNPTRLRVQIMKISASKIQELFIFSRFSILHFLAEWKDSFKVKHLHLVFVVHTY